MKMTDRDYDNFKHLLNLRLKDKQNTIQLELTAINNGTIFSSNKTTRFVWAVLHFSGIRIGDGMGCPGDINLYSYLNDDHIETALKKYCKSKGWI